MTQTSPKVTKERLRDYDREMLRSAFVGMFWAAFMRRKQTHKMKMSEFAEAAGVHKSEVSRWFSGLPNWGVNTIADIAGALDLELSISAKDRQSGEVFTPQGFQDRSDPQTGSDDSCVVDLRTRQGPKPPPRVSAA